MDEVNGQDAIPLGENHLQEKAIVRWWDVKWDGKLLVGICKNFVEKSSAFFLSFLI